MKKYILIVDDEKAIADLLEVYLKNENYNVIKYYSSTDVVRDIDNKGVYISQLFKSIPTIYKKDMKETLYIANPYYNRQSEWLLWLCRLKHMRFLLDILGERGIARNLLEINNFPTEIRYVESNSTPLLKLTDTIKLDEIRNNIDYIKEKI